MCKVCASCHGVMNYDPYFDAEVCVKCGKIERKSQEEISKLFFAKRKGNNILKRNVDSVVAHS